MGKKIYIVTAGEYSDYGIVEVFENEQKAVMFAKAYNNGDYIYGNAQIEVYETHDDCVDTGKDKIEHLFLYPINQVGVFNEYFIAHRTIFKDFFEKWYVKVEGNKITINIDKFRNGTFVFCVLDKEDNTKAEKILQDKIAEVKAEMFGV